MFSKNYQELIRVADLLNSYISISKDTINVNIVKTTTKGFIYLKAENTNLTFNNNFVKELLRSGFENIEVKNIDNSTTTFKFLLQR